tara:strand:- start:297 stop:794 length:498 start_codon:yes stop_codon:yes gene_type:complete
MKTLKYLLITFVIISSGLTSITKAETLKFASATYEGEVKKGKANGVGVFTFSDGSTYKGKVKKNKIHGKGIYTDPEGNVYEGKFRFGSYKSKIDKKTRSVIKLKPKTGIENVFEVRGTGALISKWFEAEKNASGRYVLNAKGKRKMAAAEAAAASASSSSGGSSC